MQQVHRFAFGCQVERSKSREQTTVGDISHIARSLCCVFLVITLLAAAAAVAVPLLPLLLLPVGVLWRSCVQPLQCSQVWPHAAVTHCHAYEWHTRIL